jgi:nucleoid DNA-binding protein
MNANITFVELVDLMANATSTSKRVCELFLKDLFAVVSQELINGNNVTIKGVGTFKVTRVKPHKGVDARTGSSKKISGYSKVTFTPDKSLAEAVNQPFAQFETVILDDAVTDEKLVEIDKLHPSAVTAEPSKEELKPSDDKSQKPAPVATIQPESVPLSDDEPIYGESDIPVAPLPFELPEMQDAAPAPSLDDLIRSTVPDSAVSVASAVQAPAEEKPIVEKKIVKEEPVKEEKPKPDQSDKPLERKPMLVGRPIDGPSQPVPEQDKEEEVNTDRHFYRPEPRNVYTPTPEQIEEATRKPDRRWLWLLLSAIAIVLMFWLMARGCEDSQADAPEQEVVAADTVTDEEITEDLAKAESKSSAEDKSKKTMEEKVKAEADKRIEKKEDAKLEQKPQQKPAAKAPSSTKEVTDVVTSQIVLTTLSEKHYGSPWFWVYIYEENVARGTINDPNNIRPGTRVVIPPASKYGIDPNDKASLKKAQIKSMEYLKGR